MTIGIQSSEHFYSPGFGSQLFAHKTVPTLGPALLKAGCGTLFNLKLDPFSRLLYTLYYMFTKAGSHNSFFKGLPLTKALQK